MQFKNKICFVFLQNNSSSLVFQFESWGAFLPLSCCGYFCCFGTLGQCGKLFYLHTSQYYAVAVCAQLLLLLLLLDCAAVVKVVDVVVVGLLLVVVCTIVAVKE